MNILLVEDNSADAYLLIELLEQQHISNIKWVMDGRDAMDYIARRDPYTRMPRPDIILLDLGLPRISGYDALADLKQDPHYQSIPILVLTTSCSPLDERQCMDLGANGFITKPRSLRDYEKLASKLATSEFPRLMAA